MRASSPGFFEARAPTAGAAMGVALGVAAMVKAPDGHAAVAWAAALCVGALGGRIAVGRYAPARAAAAFAGSLLAFVPLCGVLALATLGLRVTSESEQLGCGLGFTLMILYAVPLALCAAAAAAITTGAWFGQERPRLERALVPAAAIGCLAAVGLGIWTWSAGAPLPTTGAAYVASLPTQGVAEELRLDPGPRDATMPQERIHHVDHVGAGLHRVCLPPDPDAYRFSGTCWIAIGDTPNPQQVHNGRWAGPVSSLTRLEARFDERRGVWIVVAGQESYAFRVDTGKATVLTTADVMTGPPSSWGFVGALGAAIALLALALHRRRPRALAEIAEGIEGTVTSTGWVALDDGRTVRTPEGSWEGGRVVVVAPPRGNNAYRDAEAAYRVLPGDRAHHVARVRAAMAADALVALVAASVAIAVLVAPLLK